jgi:O-antigen ligase
MADDQTRGIALMIGVAAGLTIVAIAAGGGQIVTGSGPVLTLVVLGVTALFGRVAFTGRVPHPFSGFTTIALLTAFALWSGLSIGWSILPDDSYVDAGRTLAYVSVFAAIALTAQLMRGRHGAIAGAILIAAVTICGYSLLSRIAPGWFSELDNYARLRAPFEYWNAVGLVAACGLMAAVWLGTRREATRALTVASYPAGSLLVVALMLSQSRGALVAAMAGVALWLLLAPRRLRTVGWLAVVGAIGAIVVAWAFSQTALSTDAVAADIRSSTGARFAIVLLLAVAVATAAGYGVEHLRAARPMPDAQRYAVGKALLIALMLSPLVIAAGLVTTERGAWGTVSHAVSDLTDSSKLAPGNSPDRLTQTSSLRARYWHDGFEVWSEHKLQGTGADTFTASRLPYREDTLKVAHTHGFVPQTLADLGIVGMGFALAALIAWVIAALRAIEARRCSPTHWLANAGDAGCALASLIVVAVVFGVHSTVDWTWYVPGAALFGLVAAGWVAGSARNPEVEREGPPRDDSGQPLWTRSALAAGVVLIGVSTMLSIYHPAQAADRVDEGYRLAGAGHPYLALAKAREANDLDHLADEPFYLIADAQSLLGRDADAEKSLETIAVRQPANPDTWLHLAEFRLWTQDDPQGALQALGPLLFLSPNSERGLALEEQAKQQLVEQRYREAVRKAKREYDRKVQRYLKRQQTANQ